MSPSLARLRLGSNSLNGVIPSANFATLEKLTYLELDNNSFTGMIPPELGDCQTLTLLNLAQNKLNDSLPAQLGNRSSLQLQELTNLSLQNNYLSGSIPDSIGNMNSLIELQLGENKLSGRIPSLPVKLQIALNLSSSQLGCTSGPILLLDLSSKNIMLKSLKEPHLGDIELCKVIDPSKRTGSLSTLAGSVGYIPPEYAYTMGVTAAGNVYGFRVILLELLTRKPPKS
ncbi:hypothetical protein Patl1_07835 [Pistacia atlantica]|uniref:Uncharacterized protein n=1 Tax=Pistacia atlantica TaxID=434234 RepID=A0ACC1AKX1_9ROSI|nr:hypothetical protein Patl1_07835 [Pistacia atlantica]